MPDPVTLALFAVAAVVLVAVPGPNIISPLTRLYRQGVLVQVLNPKVALFFLAFLPQFIDPDQGPVAVQVLVLGALLALIGFCIDALYAVAAGAAGAWLRARPRMLGRVRYLTASVYIALGAGAALSGTARHR